MRMTLIGDNSLPVENQSKTEFTRSYLESFLAQHAGEPWLMRMQFPGVVSKEALLEAYSQCDIFCAPSRFESFGIIFLEAMRAEKPVVGTRVGGILEIVTDGVEGYLIPPNAPVPLEWALSQLIQSPDLRARMGRSARQTFEKRFLARIMAEKSMELYDLAVKNHKTCL